MSSTPARRPFRVGSSPGRVGRATVRAAVFGAITALLLVAYSGSAAASHLSCGEVVTEDVRFDADLTGCTGPGLVIGADNVTIDLDGHQLQGRGGVGILSSDGHDRVRVLDGEISAFQTAVEMTGLRGGRLRDLSIFPDEFSGTGIVLTSATGTRVADNLVVGPDAGVAVRISGGRRVRVLRSSVWGLHMTDTERSLIRGNSVGAWAPAISLNRSNHNIVTGNEADSLTDGILVSRSSANVVRGNTVESLDAGIRISDSDDTSVVANAATDADLGFGVVGTSDGTLLRKNRAPCCPLVGFYVGPQTANTLLVRNEASHASDDGILVKSPLTTLARNRAFSNGELGINAVEGVTDGGGNVAFDNGDPRQCVNVVCSGRSR